MGTVAQTGIAEMGDILQGQGAHCGRAMSHAEIAKKGIEEAKARKKEVKCLNRRRDTISRK
jgi:ribosomal protein L13E